MLKALIVLLVVTPFLACTSLKNRADDPKFAVTTEAFFKDYWPIHPEHASLAGLTDYENLLQIPSKKNRQQRIDFYSKQLEIFKNASDEDLSLGQRTDRMLIVNEMEKRLWHLNEFKSWQWQPNIYNIGDAVGAVLEKQKRPLEDRLRDLSEKLLKAPEYYQEAKNNIRQPTYVHTKLAVTQTAGLIKYLKGDVKKKVKDSKLGARDKKTLNQRISAAAAAAKRYRTFLQGVLADAKKVGGFRSYRIGKENYAQKFKFDLQIEASPEELYKKAVASKKEIRSKMFEKAIELYPKYFGEKLPPKDRQKVISSIIDKVSKNHTKPGALVETVRKQIPELTKFIQDKELLTLDADRPLKVRETPPYQRGFAGASVDSPGPFDKGRETYYNVHPLDDMSKKEQESWLREYNDYTLQILNIHEAVPGHYVQLVYSNKTPSLVKALFHNGPLVEGWAVYAERMMLEAGYGADSPELWLMYYKWFLRVVTNTIIDYELHNEKLSRKEAMAYMTRDAFQEESEAKGKWNRATVSQVQLASYFAGFSEIYDLRETIKQDEGSSFDLKEFHENFLSFGSAPIKDIKSLML